MKRTADVLERTFYLTRIRSMEIRAYMVQIAAMVGIGFFFSLLQGATFKPFYLPMSYFSYVVLIMLTAMCFESFFFTMLEIRSQDSDSARYFTAKKASKNALKIMVIALIVIALFANPAAESTWEGVMEESHTIEMVNSTASFEFSSLDRFGITESTVEINPTTYTGNYTVYVFDKERYHSGISYTLKRYSIEAEAPNSVSIYPPDSGTYNEYVVVIKGNGSGEFSYTIHRGIISGYTLYTALFLSAIALSEAWWFVYLQKIIKKYGTELVSESAESEL